MSSEPNNPIHEPSAAPQDAVGAEGPALGSEATAPDLPGDGAGEARASEAVPVAPAATPAEAPDAEQAEAPVAEHAEAPDAEHAEAPIAGPSQEPPAPEAPPTPIPPVAVPETEPAKAEIPPSPPKPSLPKSDQMDWYILKVQSNREESIREGLRRRIAIAGYEHLFGEIIIPTEKITEVKGGKKRTYKRKLYPGYLVVQMEINEDTWFLVRETPGIGDFTGAGGHPTPMNPREVQSILAKQEEKPDQQEKVKINFHVGDRVKIKEGTFENFEGEVSSIDETNGRVTVLINIFGRSTPVDIEYWQIEAV